MKKNFILALIVTLLSISVISAEATTQRPVKRKTTTTRKAPKPATVYALFDQIIPFDGKVPTVEDFGYKKSDKIKTVIENGIDDEAIGFSEIRLDFDPEGRLILSENNPDDAYSPTRFNITYQDNGKVESITYTYQPAVQDSYYTPLIKCVYTYNWDGDKVDEITETITVDEGINYKGQPTHLKMKYDTNGNLASATCKENPKVSFQFDNNGRLIKKGTYSCDYKNYIDQGYNPTSLDKLFTAVNKKKAPLKWSFYTQPDQYSSVEDLNRGNSFLYGMNYIDESSKPIYKYDQKNNWTSATIFYDGGKSVITRDITYY